MEKALVEINGGAWDGTVFTIEIDPTTNEPPPEFQVTDDGLYLITSTGRLIGRRYGDPNYDSKLDDFFPRECPGA